jgi:phosphatidylinositol alpha-1,6-mannosyltransferase
MVTAMLAWPLGGVFRRSGVRTAAIVHGLDVTTPFRPWQWLVRRAFARLDLVLPVSEATGLACIARGLAPDRLRPVRNGVDVRRFLPLLSAPSARRRLIGALQAPDHPLPEFGGLVLVSVGRHVRRKGFEWFVRQVMPLLPEDVHYWIAGDGPETAAIRAAAAETGLERRVRLLGRISEEDLHTLYRGADLFVMPNVPVKGDMEGFGVVMLEAGLGGLTTVGSALEGIAEVITEGTNGHLVQSGNAGAFVSAIMRYHDEPELRLRGAYRTYTHTRRHFGWKTVSREYVRVLGSLFRGEPIPEAAPPAAVTVGV